MKYDEALRAWGKWRLEQVGFSHVDVDTVTVDMEFNEGYSCCGGLDPNCYCSFAESPSADVVISGKSFGHNYARFSIPQSDFNFAEIIREIVEVADGIER